MSTQMRIFLFISLCIISVGYVSTSPRLNKDCPCGPRGGPPHDPARRKKMTECSEETGYKLPIRKEVKTEDAKYGCFQACILKKEGVLVNNKIDVEAAVSLYKGERLEGEVKYEVNKCVDALEKDTDECAKALAFTTCFLPDRGRGPKGRRERLN